MAEHPSDLVRDQYVMKLAGGLDIDADRLREAVAACAAAAVARAVARAGERRRGPRRPAPTAAHRRVHARRNRGSPGASSTCSSTRCTTARLVDGWIDAHLFADPIARRRSRRSSSTPDVHDAIEGADGAVRTLLERVAVEEPIEDYEPQTLRARLMANAVAPAAERVLMSMVRAGDDRASSVEGAARLVDLRA